MTGTSWNIALIKKLFTFHPLEDKSFRIKEDFTEALSSFFDILTF
jgi:hypothetical protein